MSKEARHVHWITLVRASLSVSVNAYGVDIAEIRKRRAYLLHRSLGMVARAWGVSFQLDGMKADRPVDCHLSQKDFQISKSRSDACMGSLLCRAVVRWFF